MANPVTDSSSVVKKLKQACLPFKPSNSASPVTPIESPVTPVGSSTGKKRPRATQPHSGGRCAPKNIRVDVRKLSDKSSACSSDDKVVSSSCEIDSSSAVCLSTSPKAISSRSSLDYFVHTTQNVEITTSSKDADDMVDLTVEDENASEAVSLPCLPIVSAIATDATNGALPNGSQMNVKPITTRSLANEAAAVSSLDDENKENICSDESHETAVLTGNTSAGDDSGEYHKRDCNSSDVARETGSVGSTQVSAELSGSGENLPAASDSTGTESLPQHNENDCPPSCIAVSPVKGNSSGIDNDTDKAESFLHDEASKADKKLNQATVVLVKLPVSKENMNVKADDSGSKSDMSTSSVEVNNGDQNSPNLATNAKPKPKKKVTREEQQRLKEEREKERVIAKERREQDRQDAKVQKEQERVEKLKEKEQAQKEKDQKKKEKEEERLRRLEQIEEDKKKKLELKAEEKKKKEEKKGFQENKVSKEKELMQKFFIAAKENTPAKAQEVKTGPFMDFEVKKDMRIAPLCRLPGCDIVSMASQLDEHLVSQNADVLYVDQLRRALLQRHSYAQTWPSRDLLASSDVELLASSDVVMLPSRDYPPEAFMRAKLLQFHENYRPAYYGTWRKRSSVITARRPFQCDTEFFAYDVDSDDEWEEEEPGESLSHSEGEDDEENNSNPEDEGDEEFFVPHGYLSDGEGCSDDDEERKVTPEKLKDELLAKMKTWDAEVADRKHIILPPVVTGISWCTPDSRLSQLDRKLLDFQVVLLDEAPFEAICLTKEQTVKNKATKEVKGKSNLLFVPIPDADLPDLARLVHGNSRSIQKLVREFCEFWRSRNNPVTATDDSAPDANTPVRKVSKRKVEAKIRQIAVYEFRPQSYKRKLWYVGDETLEKLSLSLPVPTEWLWVTQVFTKGTEVHDADAAKQSVSASVQPSPNSGNGTIKSFMASMTPNGSQPSSSAVTVMNQSEKSPNESQPTSAGKESVHAVITVATPQACSTEGTRPPCSTMAGKKRKVRPDKRRSLPVKQQPCLPFTRHSLEPPPAAAADCVVLVSSCDKAMADAAVRTAEPNPEYRSLSSSVEVDKNNAPQRKDDDDCMVVDSCIADAQPPRVKSAAKTQRLESTAAHSTVPNASLVISVEKSVPGIDAKTFPSEQHDDVDDCVIVFSSVADRQVGAKSVAAMDANCNVERDTSQ